MIDQLYFEEHPWNRVCAAISQRNLGKVYEIAVQAVCGTGESRTVFETWLAKRPLRPARIRASKTEYLGCDCDRIAGHCVLHALHTGGGGVLRTSKIVENFVG